MIEIHWIRRKLYEWGVRNRATGIGYPNMSATEKARIGRGGLVTEPSLPPDLEEIDLAVRLLKPDQKMIIAECYTHGGTHSDHMIRLQLTSDAYFARKKNAEKKVYWLVQANGGKQILRAG